MGDCVRSREVMGNRGSDAETDLALHGRGKLLEQRRLRLGGAHDRGLVQVLAQPEARLRGQVEGAHERVELSAGRGVERSGGEGRGTRGGEARRVASERARARVER